MEEEIKIDDAWHMLMHYPNVWLGDYPEELYQAFLEIGREELVFHSKKQKTIEEITELMIRVSRDFAFCVMRWSALEEWESIFSCMMKCSCPYSD